METIEHTDHTVDCSWWGPWKPIGLSTLLCVHIKHRIVRGQEVTYLNYSLQRSTEKHQRNGLRGGEGEELHY